VQPWRRPDCQSADRCWLGRPVTPTSCRPAATPAQMPCCNRLTAPLAPCCLVPVGREDNAVSSRVSDSDCCGLSKQSSLTCVFSWLKYVGLMERVKICFTIIRQHQDRCLSAWHSRLNGMEERTKGASHETTVD